MTSVFLVAMRVLAVGTVTLLIAAACHAEVVPVPQPEKATFGTNDPTMTFLWRGTDTGVVLIYLPGGDGSIGMKPSWPELSYHAHLTLKKLTDPAQTSGKLDVVIFDSPKKFFDYGTSVTRSSGDHMTRIENTVNFYREMLKKPVWLMGHSNGTVSLTEFYKHLRGKGREDLVDGYIYSGGRNGYSFGNDIKQPVLFLHHEKDSCDKTTPGASLRVFNSLKEAGKARTEYAVIRTGQAEGNNPCFSGHHMYFGAGDEVAKAIDEFVQETAK